MGVLPTSQGAVRIHGASPSVSGSCCFCRNRDSVMGQRLNLCATFLPQEAEIDNIHQLVVGATENIKEGNEDIREVGTLWAPSLIWRGTEAGRQWSPWRQGCLRARLGQSPRADLTAVHCWSRSVPAKLGPCRGASWVARGHSQQGSDQLPKSRAGATGEACWTSTKDQSPGHCLRGLHS